MGEFNIYYEWRKLTSDGHLVQPREASTEIYSGALADFGCLEGNAYLSEQEAYDHLKKVGKYYRNQALVLITVVNT